MSNLLEQAISAIFKYSGPICCPRASALATSVEGLEEVDPNSAEGQRFAAVFNTLHENCK
jgi:hypothetical protein